MPVFSAFGSEKQKRTTCTSGASQLSDHKGTAIQRPTEVANVHGARAVGGIVRASQLSAGDLL